MDDFRQKLEALLANEDLSSILFGYMKIEGGLYFIIGRFGQGDDPAALAGTGRSVTEAFDELERKYQFMKGVAKDDPPQLRVVENLNPMVAGCTKSGPDKYRPIVVEAHTGVYFSSHLFHHSTLALVEAEQAIGNLEYKDWHFHSMAA